MSFFEKNPIKIFDNIKELLVIAAKDRSHAFHTPVFSNNNDNNLTSSRIVVLRKFNKDNLTLNFHTDYRSPKIIDLEKNKQSNFVFYDFKIKIQLRVKTITTIHYDDKVTADAWAKTQLYSRKCYLTKKSPSSITDKAEDGIPDYLKGIEPTQNDSETGYVNFSVIENSIQNIDWLYLSASGHQRLNISFDNIKPIFKWLIP